MKTNFQYFLGTVTEKGFGGLTGTPFEKQGDAVKEARSRSLAPENLDETDPRTIKTHFLVIEGTSAEHALAWAQHPDTAEYIGHLAENRIYEGIRMVGLDQSPSRILILDKTQP